MVRKPKVFVSNLEDFLESWEEKLLSNLKDAETPTIFSAKKTFFVPSKLVRDELANSSKNQQNYIQEVGQTLNLKYRLFKRYVGFLFSVGYS